MEDEIDLRKYFGVLVRRWKWVVAFTVIAAGAVLIVSSIVPPTYQATALVIVTGPRYQLQFDPRIQNLTDLQQPYKAFPELALNDDLVRQVIDGLGSKLEVEDHELARFRARLSARGGSDPSLIRLAATDQDPKQAQDIANTWAEQYVTYANDLYQQRSSEVAFFETQVTEADQKLKTAEQALVDFQARNPLLIATIQLSATQTTLVDYLAADQRLALIVQNARSLQQQLAQQDSSETVTLADELAALYVQIDALSTQPNVPIQLQISGSGVLANRTVAEQIASLNALVDALQDKSAEIKRQVEALQPDILALQKTREEAQVELDRLTRDRDVARDTYFTLARKLDEARVAAQDVTGEVRLASRAAVPTEPVGPRKVLNTVLGSVLGLIVGVIVAFVIDARRPVAEKSPVLATSTRAN